MKLTEIREARAIKIAEMRALTGAEMNDEGKKRFDTLKAEVVALEQDEARAQFLADSERRSLGEPVDRQAADLQGRINVLDVIRSQMEGRALTGAAAEFAQEAERRTGRKAAGVYVPLGALEQRVSTTGSAGQIVPTDHRADQFIEPFRNALLARRLGVRVLSGLSGNVSIPKHGTSTTTGWVAEGAALSPSDMTFGSVSLTPRHAGGMVEVSRQLVMQSSPDIESLVRADLSAMLAKAIDAALIKGGGTNEPKGVLATAGTQVGNLATLNWANVSAMIGKLETANADVSASSWLMAPAAAHALRTTLKSATAGSEFVLQDGKVGGLAAYSTNQVPTTGGGTPKNIAVLGDWSQVLLGLWSELDILVNPYAETPYSKGNILIRAMSTVDIALRHPEGFVIAQDLA